jgi:hypothetical protein
MIGNSGTVGVSVGEAVEFWTKKLIGTEVRLQTEVVPPPKGFHSMSATITSWCWPFVKLEISMMDEKDGLEMKSFELLDFWFDGRLTDGLLSIL